MYDPQITERELDESFYWDLYKEVHGIRPRHVRFGDWSDAELAQEIERLWTSFQLSRTVV